MLRFPDRREVYVPDERIEAKGIAEYAIAVDRLRIARYERAYYQGVHCSTSRVRFEGPLQSGVDVKLTSANSQAGAYPMTLPVLREAIEYSRLVMCQCTLTGLPTASRRDASGAAGARTIARLIG